MLSCLRKYLALLFIDQLAGNSRNTIDCGSFRVRVSMQASPASPAHSHAAPAARCRCIDLYSRSNCAPHRPAHVLSDGVSHPPRYPCAGANVPSPPRAPPLRPESQRLQALLWPGQNSLGQSPESSWLKVSAQFSAPRLLQVGSGVWVSTQIEGGM